MKKEMLKIRISGKQKEFLAKRAAQLDMSISAYMGYLIIKDLSERSPDNEVAFMIFENFDEIYDKLRNVMLRKNMQKIKF